ncbi:MAG TPA: hypothetical protein VGM56_25350 [Byssovorax sp.]|jgi:hypothetical protein
MQSLSNNEIVGFVQLKVGSLDVQVPVRAIASHVDFDDSAPASRDHRTPVVSFQTEGDSCAILVRGDHTSKAVESAMGPAMKEAVKHLSRKLLN